MQRAMKLLVLFLSFFSISAANCFGAENTALQQMLLRLKPATVLIFTKIEGKVTTDNGDIPLEPPITMTGSGFIVSPDGYVLTNGHVVSAYQEQSDEAVQDFFVRRLQKTKGPALEYIRRYGNAHSTIKINRKLYAILSNGDPYVAEVKQFSPPITREAGKSSTTGLNFKTSTETGKDVAVLKIEGRDFPTVPLGDSSNVQLGEPIYVIGYPGVVLEHDYLSQKTALDSTVTIGHVSGSKLDVKGTPVIQTDVSLTWGNSGGPAFNSKGEVVGIPTFISIVEKAGTQQAIQGFNFLVPANTAMEFVRASGANIGTESLFNKLWNEALTFYAASDRGKTLAKIDEVNRILPNQPDVRKVQLAAQRMEPTKPKLSPQSIVLISAGLLLVAGLAVFSWRRKKQEEPAQAQPDAKAPARAQSAPTVGISTTTKAEAPAATLKCNEGPLAGRTYPISSEGIRIGRDPGKNQIVIDHDGISREHASIMFENGKAVIRDHNSLNGTFLKSTDSDRIKREILKDGDVIIIGKGKFASFTFTQP